MENVEMWQGLPITYRGRIQPEWIDHNGHMNVGFYMVVFDYAVEDWIGPRSSDRPLSATQDNYRTRLSE